MSLDSFTELMHRLGPETPGIDEIQQSGNDQWTIGLSGGVVIVMQTDGNPATALMLSTLVGRPPVDRRHLVYESLLAFNATARPGAAVTLGLDGPDGEVMLRFNRPAAGITLDELSHCIARFCEFADMWAQYVTAVEQPEPTYRSPLLMTMLV